MNEAIRPDKSLLPLPEVARKVRWEGGVLAALEYGIGSEDIADADLAALWQRMESLYESLRPMVRETELMLRQARRAA